VHRVVGVEVPRVGDLDRSLEYKRLEGLGYICPLQIVDLVVWIL